MASLPLLIALLTFIDITRSFEYFIDLERCKTEEMVCYVRESCIDTPISGDQNVLVKYIYEKLKGDTCDVIIQMKAFSEKRFHIMIQVNVSASETPLNELDMATGISIVQQETQIKCNSNGIEGRMASGSYGSRQLYTKALIFCSAILADTSEKGIFFAFPKQPYGNILPTLEISFLNMEKMILKYVAPGKAFWTVSEKCNDKEVHTSNDVYNDLVLSEINAAYAILSCPNPQKMFVRHDSFEAMSSSVYCDSSNQWSFKNETDGVVSVTQTRPFRVHCAIKFSEICASSPILFKNCAGCSEPTPIGNDTFKCVDNKWRMSDGSVEETEVKCKRMGNERTSAWQTNEGKNITEGACSADFDCATFNNFDFTVPKKDKVHLYKAVDQIGSGNRLNCSEGFNLAIYSNNVTKIIDGDLVCDTGNGFFYPEGHRKEQDKQTNNTSSVYCAKKHGEEEDKPENAQPATGAMSSTMIAASIGGAIVVLFIIGGIIVFVLLRRPKETKEEKDVEEKPNCPDIDPSKTDRLKNPDP